MRPEGHLSCGEIPHEQIEISLEATNGDTGDKVGKEGFIPYMTSHPTRLIERCRFEKTTKLNSGRASGLKILLPSRSQI